MSKSVRFFDWIHICHNLTRFLGYILAHEQASRTARLRHEMTQSRKEQNEYLRNVELARGLDKRREREERKRKNVEEGTSAAGSASLNASMGNGKMKYIDAQLPPKKKKTKDASSMKDIDDIL